MTSSVGDPSQFPGPLPWEDRAASMIWIPGSPEQTLDRLSFFLTEISSDTLDLKEIAWPDNGELFSTKHIVGTFRRCGLVRRDPQKRCGLELTLEASTWLETKNPEFLVAILHANIKFVGELLHYLDDRLTHEQLREAADRDFALGWKTHDQIRRRTNWLRAAGYVELWTNFDVVLTERGRAARNHLQVTSPSDLRHNRPASIASISEPPPAIASALSSLTLEKLANRRRAISYIPGGDDTARTIASLVTFADPTVSKDDFVSYCTESFSISESSADSALQTLRSAGLIEQTGPSSFSPSPLAVEWIESGDSLDLVRILHCNFLAFGETLHAITEVDGSGKISKYLDDRFGVPQLPVTEVARRVRLLHSSGLVDQITQFVYRINPLGAALLGTLPLMEQQSAVALQSRIGAPDAWDGTELIETGRINEAESVAAELTEAAFDATRHRRLEAAVAAAFKYLGFSARHLGYSDRTDVLLTAWLAPGKSRTIIVDAKAASAGFVEEGRVNFDKLELHRGKHDADKIVVVGTDFAGRLSEFAANRSVTLLKTDDLAAWVRRHGDVPMSISALVSLLDGEDSRTLRRDWEESNQRRDVFSGVIQQLWESANNEADIRMSGGALSSRDLWISLRGEYPDAQLSDIDATLQFLASALVGGIRRAKDGAYVMVDPPALLIRKIHALISTTEPSSPTSSEIDDVDATQDSANSFEAKTQTSNGGPRSSEVAQPSDGIDAAAVRKWAKRQGIPVRDRGRLTRNLVDKYRESLES